MKIRNNKGRFVCTTQHHFQHFLAVNSQWEQYIVLANLLGIIPIFDMDDRINYLMEGFSMTNEEYFKLCKFLGKKEIYFNPYVDSMVFIPEEFNPGFGECKNARDVISHIMEIKLRKKKLEYLKKKCLKK